ncbi:MAG: PD-(D/E)XK nuclease family protein [Actinobacteria bacterium]|nr:PD-(D/E)XK nuclease family protein [Actinomycetota bacterium]
MPLETSRTMVGPRHFLRWDIALRRLLALDAVAPSFRGTEPCRALRRSSSGQQVWQVGMRAWVLPCVISAVPSDQVIAALQKNVSTLWTAVTRACSTGSFIPRPSALCNWCGFKGICPAHQDMGAQGVQGTHY